MKLIALFNTDYPSIEDLIKKAKKKVPRFALDYLQGGCNEDVNLIKNTRELRDIELLPVYLKPFAGVDMRTELFGHVYDAPFGIAPIGLQGLIWPNAPEILAKAAYTNNIPFILSTVSTTSIERISEITEGRAWYQLYHPAETKILDDIIQRAQAAAFPVLVLLCDVPSFGFRPRDIRNGLAMPPKMSVSNILQIAGKPEWAMRTLIYGQPSFKTLEPYMPKGLNLRKLGAFMDKTFSGRLNESRIAYIRDRWKGKLVLKGVASDEDAQMAVQLGLDGIIVSNHGGRQIDAGQSAIQSLLQIVKNYSGKIKIMMDSGIRSGPDIARTIAAGAEFAFLGRSFMYGVGALGDKGGEHTISLLKTQLRQVMDQLGCESVGELKRCLVK